MFFSTNEIVDTQYVFAQIFHNSLFDNSTLIQMVVPPYQGHQLRRAGYRYCRECHADQGRVPPEDDTGAVMLPGIDGNYPLSVTTELG